MGYPVGNLSTLNNGWPFGDGPLEWPARGEVRDGQVHLVCHRCEQSVMPLALTLDTQGYAVTGDMLRSRIADHCLKVHSAELGDAILT